MFIFSNYKVREENLIKVLKNNTSNLYDEEVLRDQDRIFSETYTTDIKTTDYGGNNTYVYTLTRLDNNFRIVERAIFQKQTEYIAENSMKEKIRSHGFEIAEIDSNSHSDLYVLIKR